MKQKLHNLPHWIHQNLWDDGDGPSSKVGVPHRLHPTCLEAESLRASDEWASHQEGRRRRRTGCWGTDLRKPQPLRSTICGCRSVRLCVFTLRLTWETPYLDRTDDVGVDVFAFNQLCQDPFDGSETFKVSFRSFWIKRFRQSEC